MSMTGDRQRSADGCSRIAETHLTVPARRFQSSPNANRSVRMSEVLKPSSEAEPLTQCRGSSPRDAPHE